MPDREVAEGSVRAVRTALPHVHLLLWHGAPERTAAASFVRQDCGAPLDFSLRDAVRQQQCSQQGASAAEATAEATHWAWEAGRWRLKIQSSAEAQALGPRAYLEPMTRAYLGHHDAEPLSGTAALAAYLAKLGAYVTKSAESLTTDAFDHGHVAMHAVRSLLQFGRSVTRSVLHVCVASALGGDRQVADLDRVKLAHALGVSSRGTGRSACRHFQALL